MEILAHLPDFLDLRDCLQIGTIFQVEKEETLYTKKRLIQAFVLLALPAAAWGTTKAVSNAGHRRMRGNVHHRSSRHRGLVAK
jgi:hypothetical protein